jgi:hypothetical protein
VNVIGPKKAETGLTEITLINKGKTNGDMQLIRVEGKHSAKEVVRAFEGVTGGRALPDWFYAGGGIGTTEPGQSQTVTQVLQPGTYYGFDTEAIQGQVNPALIPVMEVSGEESDEDVEGEMTVSAFDYGFDAEPLPSGKTEVAFDNTGAEPHHLLAAPLLGQNTAKDAESFFKANEGKPPFGEEGTISTAVIEGGEDQLVTLDLKPGRYVLFCFISDREGGSPHAIKGMVDEVEVE